MSYYINHIEPSIESAKEVIDLRFKNMVCSGVPEHIANKVADSGNAEHIGRQIDKLRLNNIMRQFGAFSLKSNSMVGYFTSDEWHATDQLPFSHGLEYVDVAARSMISDTLAGSPLGVHELLVDDCDEGAEEVIDMLLHRITIMADEREVVTPIRNNHMILSALARYGFELTDRQADFPDGHKMLCRRPQYVFSQSEFNQARQAEYC